MRHRLGLATRTQISVCKLPFPSAGTAEPLNTSYTTYYYRDLKMWVRGHSRSLELVHFESLGAVSSSPSIMAVSVAVCEIFSVKEWRDLENQVRGRSRSLKMARSIHHMRLSIGRPL